MSRFQVQLIIFLAAAIFVTSQASAQQGEPAAATVSVSDDGQVARAVRGIISYTRWPATPSAIRLCLVGDSAYRDQISAGVQRVAARPVKVRQIQADRIAVQSCDVLYFGGSTGALASGLVRQGLLTISEQDIACRGGGMFCLRIAPGRVAFQLNLDAVARSGLRIDPKVLIMGSGGEGLP